MIKCNADPSLPEKPGREKPKYHVTDIPDAFKENFTDRRGVMSRMIKFVLIVLLVILTITTVMLLVMKRDPTVIEKVVSTAKQSVLTQPEKTTAKKISSSSPKPADPSEFPMLSPHFVMIPHVRLDNFMSKISPNPLSNGENRRSGLLDDIFPRINDPNENTNQRIRIKIMRFKPLNENQNKFDHFGRRVEESDDTAPESDGYDTQPSGFGLGNIFKTILSKMEHENHDETDNLENQPAEPESDSLLSPSPTKENQHLRLVFAMKYRNPEDSASTTSTTEIPAAEKKPESTNSTFDTIKSFLDPMVNGLKSLKRRIIVRFRTFKNIISSDSDSDDSKPSEDDKSVQKTEQPVKHEKIADESSLLQTNPKSASSSSTSKDSSDKSSSSKSKTSNSESKSSKDSSADSKSTSKDDSEETSSKSTDTKASDHSSETKSDGTVKRTKENGGMRRILQWLF